MLVTRLRREERGGILALSAIMIPVFIVLTAMVVDVGQWYTHKRQLQTRADAGALAAGVEYAANWQPCVQSSDATLKANAARGIANVARQYAADPEATDYAPDSLPTPLYNENIATQSKLDVVINSTTYADDTDYSDGGGSPPLGTPCFIHSGDTISPAGGHWVDVRVKENDLPSLFGAIGVPLSRNVARARVEIRPALSGNKFLPLAIPNNVIDKVQVRYYDECRDPTHTSPLSTNIGTALDLKELPAGSQGGFASLGGGTLWGLPSVSDPTVGDPSRSVALTVPSYGGCAQDYLPIGVQVRLSSNNVNLNQSCAALIAAKFADCFTRISQFRVFNDGNPDSQPRLTNVRVLGGCTPQPPFDGYFGPLPAAQNNCRYDVYAEVNWGTRSNPPWNIPGNFTVSANGVNLPRTGWTAGGVFTYQSTGGALVANPGANNIRISLDWDDNDNTHPEWPGSGPTRCGGNRCEYHAQQNAHQAFVGTTTTAGAVALVRTSQSGFVTLPGPSGLTVPGPPLENVNTGGAGGIPPSPISIYPTVGIRSVLKPGILTTLRLDDPQANQTLRCDPNFAQGQEFSAFQFGCQPWYTKNKWGVPPISPNTDWWNTTTKQCPQRDAFFSYADMGPPFGKNSPANAWQCVPTAPGLSTGQIGDDIGVATKNCTNINNNSCQQFGCVYDGNYDGKPNPQNLLDPGWLYRTNNSQGPRGTADQRVVNLFIIPYQSLKGSTGGDPQETVPILDFASFYVMNWTGSNTNQSDPCPDRTFDPDGAGPASPIAVPDPPAGAITGVFVKTVDYESGPVDATAICVPDQLGQCRASLVR
jgi:Flp pilus assembly protein TadG